MKIRNSLMMKIITIVVVCAFLINDLAYGLGTAPGSSQEGTVAEAYAIGQKLFAANIGPGARDLTNALDSVDIEKPSFIGSAPNMMQARNFRRADYNNTPKEWSKNKVNIELLKSKDLISALRSFRKNAAGINGNALSIEEGYFTVDEERGELPIARIEVSAGHRTRIVVHTKFVQMWNDLLKNDIWFDYTFEDGETRTVSLAWAVFYRLAKHEMSESQEEWKLPKSGGHINGMGDLFYIYGDEFDANFIGGRYGILNDGMWAWFLGSYCFNDNTRFNNYTLRKRLNWFFHSIEAKKMNLNEEFPNIMWEGINPGRALAIKIALNINQAYFSRKGVSVPKFTAAQNFVDAYNRRTSNIPRTIYATGRDEDSQDAKKAPGVSEERAPSNIVAGLNSDVDVSGKVRPSVLTEEVMAEIEKAYRDSKISDSKRKYLVDLWERKIKGFSEDRPVSVSAVMFTINFFEKQKEPLSHSVAASIATPVVIGALLNIAHPPVWVAVGIMTFLLTGVVFTIWLYTIDSRERDGVATLMGYLGSIRSRLEQKAGMEYPQSIVNSQAAKRGVSGSENVPDASKERTPSAAKIYGDDGTTLNAAMADAGRIVGNPLTMASTKSARFMPSENTQYGHHGSARDILDILEAARIAIVGVYWGQAKDDASNTVLTASRIAERGESIENILKPLISRIEIFEKDINSDRLTQGEKDWTSVHMSILQDAVQKIQVISKPRGSDNLMNKSEKDVQAAEGEARKSTFVEIKERVTATKAIGERTEDSITAAQERDAMDSAMVRGADTSSSLQESQSRGKFIVLGGDSSDSQGEFERGLKDFIRTAMASDDASIQRGAVNSLLHAVQEYGEADVSALVAEAIVEEPNPIVKERLSELAKSVKGMANIREDSPEVRENTTEIAKSDKFDPDIDLGLTNGVLHKKTPSPGPRYGQWEWDEYVEQFGIERIENNAAKSASSSAEDNSTTTESAKQFISLGRGYSDTQGTFERGLKDFIRTAMASDDASIQRGAVNSLLHAVQEYGEADVSALVAEAIVEEPNPIVKERLSELAKSVKGMANIREDSPERKPTTTTQPDNTWDDHESDFNLNPLIKAGDVDALTAEPRLNYHDFILELIKEHNIAILETYEAAYAQAQARFAKEKTNKLAGKPIEENTKIEEGDVILGYRSAKLQAISELRVTGIGESDQVEAEALDVDGNELDVTVSVSRGQLMDMGCSFVRYLPNAIMDFTVPYAPNMGPGNLEGMNKITELNISTMRSVYKTVEILHKLNLKIFSPQHDIGLTESMRRALKDIEKKHGKDIVDLYTEKNLEGFLEELAKSRGQGIILTTANGTSAEVVRKVSERRPDLLKNVRVINIDMPSGYESLSVNSNERSFYQAEIYYKRGILALLYDEKKGNEKVNMLFRQSLEGCFASDEQRQEFLNGLVPPENETELQALQRVSGCINRMVGLLSQKVASAIENLKLEMKAFWTAA